MFELFALIKTAEFFSSNQANDLGIPSKDNVENKNVNSIPTSWIITILIIAFGTAYIAFACNENEIPATRFLITIIAFFFSELYLIYYFIYHILFGKDCGSGRRINSVVRNAIKKK